MKAILEFSLPEEQESYDLAVNGWRAQYQLDQVWEQLLRAPFKHGYKDQELQALYESLGEPGAEFIEKLRQLYNEIVNEE